MNSSSSTVHLAFRIFFILFDSHEALQLQRKVVTFSSIVLKNQKTPIKATLLALDRSHASAPDKIQSRELNEIDVFEPSQVDRESKDKCMKSQRNAG